MQAQEYGREPMPLHALLGEDGDSDFDDPIEAVVEADAVPFTLPATWGKANDVPA